MVTFVHYKGHSYNSKEIGLDKNKIRVMGTHHGAFSERQGGKKVIVV